MESDTSSFDTAKAMEAVRVKLCEFFPATPLAESFGWTVRCGERLGSVTILTILVDKDGRIRVEFTRNLAHGMTVLLPLKKGRVIFRLRSGGVHLRFYDDPELPIIYGKWPPSADIQYLLEFLDMLLEGV